MARWILCTVLVSLCCSGCGLFKKKPKIVLRNTNIRLVGRIEQVNEEARYVLIRRYGPWKFDGGEEVAESRGDERSASLLPTGEKLGEHIAADIRSGTVEVGDAVYIRRLGTSQKPKPSANLKKPASPDNQPKPPEKL